jgi:hypothetical protein
MAARRELFFRLCAVGAFLAAMFHAAAMLSPAVARIEYPPSYPAWRHVLFIGIDLTLAWLFLRRPMWLPWAFAVLTFQILNGHGRAAWAMWAEQRHIDWISVLASVLAPIVLVVLLRDWRDRRRVVQVRAGLGR